MKFSKEYITRRLNGELPGAKAHMKMVPENRQIITEKISPKKSSVLIILECKNDKIFTYLVKRSSKMSNHPGQIGFPGGGHDVHETLAETAIREAKEEIGYLGSANDIIASLSAVYISVSNFIIYPFVVWSEGDFFEVTSPNEIDYIISFPISDYVSDNSKSITLINTDSGAIKVPAYIYNDEVVWGATAMIISELTELIK